MTAIPKIYSDSVQKQANKSEKPLCSMEDENIFGPEFYRLSFSEAVKRELDPQNTSSGDVIVEEEVWLGTNVILLPGVVVGRGSAIGAGSVLRRSVPPYSTVMGNPARVVGFRFTPEQIIEHEKALYPKEERLPLELLEKNYKKYFLDRRMEIIKYLQV